MERLVEIEKISFEDKDDVSIRPSKFSEYIGQENIKKNLHISIAASKKREESLDHILFFGPPGLGKTTLAYVIANEMGANIKVTSAPMIEKSGDLAAILTNLSKGDILFIDEIHRLTNNIEEILYSAMEDFRLDIIIGSGPAAQTIKINIENFTLIGATTRAGMLSNPLRDRFGITFRMQFYDTNELSKIIYLASKKLNKVCNNEASLEIAKRSRGTPRVALRLLRRIRDFAEFNNEDSISLKRTLEALNELGVDERGFDELDLAFLKLLTESQNKAIGLNTIAAALSEDERTIEDIIEPYLLANGYIERTARGRIATKKSYDLLNIPFKNLF
ncbi:Holliday junction branch migration DNA helicase RuvB [Helicobacter sp. MIT 14-3879]|uniref:Holliday junction branch migration DNA helicase RuvB n=1 Tax=Helicobacter sp. MIT 14-3879 TaxID=2040649 RepID=UPI000E1F511E|nr:Holliday junction branch migration DNA helicase RuvB [Helicobacter sp. MIT 14-3879]RDU65638.1 Holliday junction branch migration DNA helicase RuvB [Helicobacter sp. MIT 14-3879]